MSHAKTKLALALALAALMMAGTAQAHNPHRHHAYKPWGSGVAVWGGISVPLGYHGAAHIGFVPYGYPQHYHGPKCGHPRSAWRHGYRQGYSRGYHRGHRRSGRRHDDHHHGHDYDY